MIFLLSDFRKLGANADQHLRKLAGHCELFLVQFFDPIEAELPPPGRYRIQSGGRTFSIETGNESMRARYHERFLARRERLRALGRLRGVHILECATTDDARAILAQQFRRT